MMMDPDLFYAIGLIIFLILDLVTTAARTSILNINSTRLLAQREQVGPQINRTIALVSNLPRTQASLKSFQLLLRFLIAGFSILLFVPWTTSQFPWAISLVVLLLAGLLTYYLEWIVELGISGNPATWAIRLSVFAKALYVLMTPILVLPILFFSSSESDQEAGVTETELISLVEAGQEEGVLEQEEQKMIVSIFRLGDTLVREIMVPRIDLLALDVNTPIGDALDALQRTGHSRVPVFKDSVDNILGLVYAKDLLGIWREGRRVVSLSDYLRPAYFVPEAKKADELLAELQAKRIHMAIVVDEYGGVAGLVTLEDIVEEIVGEIRDEYDQAEELLYQAVSEDEYIFQGRIDLDDFNDIMGSELPNSEADTLSGLIYSRIGRVPTAGDNVHIENLKLTVEQVSGQRIRKVRAQRLPINSENGGNEYDVNG
jgi:CBS domain containing-hemolysin-like protein